MTAKEAYNIWAPPGKTWVDWVRPVPFASLGTLTDWYEPEEFFVPAAPYVDEQFAGAAVIVDFYGVESVLEGIALAKAGYRPIPIYNGTVEQPGARATVDNRAVGLALLGAAAVLSQISIPEDALPAFLTDSSRLNRYRMEPGIFDNSWDVYHQDLPSAEYFLKHNIQKIIILGEKINKDLKKILYGFQKKGIAVFWTDRTRLPKRAMLHRSLMTD